MDYNKIFKEIFNETKAIENTGKVADYIPELAHVNPDKFGVHLSAINGESYSFGDSEEKFSIQSIAKVFSFVLAYSRVKSDIWERMDVEPAGTPFNSLVQLEYDHGIPRNPFINAGGIVVCDILVSEFDNPKTELIQFVRELTGNSNINYNKKVSDSEKATGQKLCTGQSDESIWKYS